MSNVSHISKNTVSVTKVPVAKTSASVTFMGKSSNDLTVDEATWSIDEAKSPSIVDSPRYVLAKQNKSDRHGFDSAEFDFAEFDDTE